MKKRYLPGTYLPRNTVLHSLPITTKIGLLLTYVILFVIINQATILTILLVCLLVGTTVAGLENRGSLLPVGIGVFASSFELAAPSSIAFTTLIRVLTLILKIILFNRLIRWYGQTTPVLETLNWLQQRSQAKWTQEWMYLVSTSISIYPSIQRDLRQAIDAEHLRLGQRPNVLMWTTWFTILMSTLVQVLNRAHQIGQSAVERGFTIDTQFTSMDTLSRIENRWLTTTICLVPALLTIVLWWVVSQTGI